MALTYFYAELFGTVIAVIGLGMLINKSMMMQAMHELIENRGVLLVTGLVTLVFGLVIILTHNIWDSVLLATIVTLFGWLMALKGAILILFPHATLRRLYAGEWTVKMWPVLSVVALLVGLYLAYNGFTSY